jgi:predicted nucleotidyltransferase
MADISAGLTAEGAATWAAIAELASLVPIGQWMVVGGQMVAIHAAELDRDAPRPTSDGDIVVDIRQHLRQAMERVAEALLAMGFELHRSEEEVSTFLRGDGARIDLLAPDGVDDPVFTHRPARALQAPGATQALERSELVSVDYGSGTVVVRRPSLLGAAIAKAAAMRIPATAAERLRHEQDFLFLVELIGIKHDPRRLARELGTKDRQRLRSAAESLLADRTHPAWLSVASERDVRTVIELLLDTP